MSQPERTATQSSYDDEIDIRDLIRVLWEAKWLIGGIAALAAVIAIIVSLLLPNVYKAEALLAPAQNDRQGGLSSLAAQYGGLASLAGVDLSRGPGNDAAMGIKVLKSRKFVSDFVERHGILVELMAAEDWNRNDNTLEIDAGLYDVKAGTWVRDVGPRRTVVPSMQEAYKEFNKLLSVNEDSKTGFITIAVEHYSPHIAKQWVDWLVQDINSTMMTRDVEEAEHAIAYLQEQIGATSIAGLQSVFFRLIEEQTKTVMLARVSPEYMFRTIDPAVAPEEKSAPKRAQIALLGLILGGVLSCVFVLVRNSLSPTKAG